MEPKKQRNSSVSSSPEAQKMPGQKLEEILKLISKPASLELSRAGPSSDSWLVAMIAQKLARPLLIITPDAGQRERIKKELELFSQPALGTFPALDYYRPSGCEPSPERVACLAQLIAGKINLVISESLALFQPTLSPEQLKEYLIVLKEGKELEREEFIHKLLIAGYQVSERVEEEGELSVRGGIIDLYPPQSQLPVRIELFGEKIESLRLFDPETQRSQEKVEEVIVYPARELILEEEQSSRLKSRLFKLAEELKKQSLSAQTSYVRSLRELLNSLERKEPFYSQERFLSLAGASFSLLDYLDTDWLLVILDPLSCEKELERTRERFAQEWARLAGGGSLVPPPEKILLPPDRIKEKLKEGQKIILGATLQGKPEQDFVFDFSSEPLIKAEPGIVPNPLFSIPARLSRGSAEPLAQLSREIKRLNQEGFKVIFVSSTLSQAERLGNLLPQYQLYPAELESKEEFYQPRYPLEIGIGELERGFQVPELGLVIISEQEVFGEKIPQPPSRKKIDWKEEDLSDLEPGEPVVHIQHGVGIYRGMKQVRVISFERWDMLKQKERPSITQPCLEIEYAEGTRLYLPIDEINQIQKYRSTSERFPKLDRLGGKSFELAKKKAEESIEKLAEELLELYAVREAFSGYAYSPPDYLYQEFASRFEYEETPDQTRAIEEVIQDLCRAKPMDRLVLGDVGYGKTEVAIRASFIVAMEGKQVAMLCPTTVLAQQHYDTFRRRLKDYPFEVRMLSRFQSRSEQKKIIEELKAGICDIVIGTHRLLSNDVQFRELGLLIIDEEQRFGVVQKEKIKQWKKTVDCLTLSATPIPRTLQMAMLGLRDLSMINTPPPGRKEIHTELIHFDPELIREAILRELEREGQVFFVHNRVAGIDQLARWLARLVPEARIRIAHGQMPEKELEKVMRDFYHHKLDLLVCTAIIESGLDLPRANTIIINRADQFGLAQLYQLRGRIGRSGVQAYAYLVIPSRQAIRGDALKRLKALREFTELGSGFRLAAYDLKIRGAGNLLGKEQSGHISRIGYELYLRLLERKIRQLKGEKVEEEFEPKLKLAIPSYLPEEYVPSDSERLGWYKRLAMARDEKELAHLREELLDRYGKIPPEGENLLGAIRVKIWMRRLRVPELEAQDSIARIRFEPESRINLARLLELVRESPEQFRFTRDQRLIFQVKKGGKIFSELEKLFKAIRADT